MQLSDSSKVRLFGLFIALLIFLCAYDYDYRSYVHANFGEDCIATGIYKQNGYKIYSYEDVQKNVFDDRSGKVNAEFECGRLMARNEYKIKDEQDFNNLPKKGFVKHLYFFESNFFVENMIRDKSQYWADGIDEKYMVKDYLKDASNGTMITGWVVLVLSIMPSFVFEILGHYFS